ncbi:MAG: cyclic-di-AMP receptor [Solirubrobacterales bacterium]
MKLVMAVVPEGQASEIAERLNDRGFIVTRLSGSAGFFRRGGTTLFTSVEDEEAVLATKIIKDFVEYEKIRALAEEEEEEYQRANAVIYILPIEEHFRV